MLIQSAYELSKRSALKDAIEVRWAIHGLVVRLEMAKTILSTSDTELEKSLTNCNNWSVLDFTSPNLNARTSNLPFDVFSHCLPWQMSPSSCNNYYGYPTRDLLPSRLQSIPFRFDTLTTRHGQALPPPPMRFPPRCPRAPSPNGPPPPRRCEAWIRPRPPCDGPPRAPRRRRRCRRRRRRKGRTSP